MIVQRAAVICEFNPFHNGHKFLLEKIKEEFADEVVCIMSGNFVQRGDIAITDKYARARAALENGADMVVCGIGCTGVRKERSADRIRARL